MAKQKGKWYWDLVNIIPRINNSVNNTIKFKEADGTNITYIVDELYRVGGMYMCNFLMIRRVNNADTYLITVESARELIKRGYIVNAKTEGGYIRKHGALMQKYHINHFPEITEFKREEFKSFANEWKEQYGNIIVIDELPTNIADHRLEVLHVIYDLSGHVAALGVGNEFKKEDIIPLTNALELGKSANNKGNAFPCTGHKNATKLLDYHLVSEESYTDCLLRFGDIAEKACIRNVAGKDAGDKTSKGKDRKLSYKCRFETMPLELARYFFGKEYVYFVIPKPEKFSNKKIFESSIKHADYLENTRYTADKYTLVSCIKFDRESAIDLLMQNYEELHTGDYLNDYKDIVEWLLNKKKEKDDIALNNLKDFVLNNLAEGKSKDDIEVEVRKRYGVMVTDEINIPDMEQLDECITDMRNMSHAKLLKSTDLRYSYFDEILDVADLSISEQTELEDEEDYIDFDDSHLDKILDKLGVEYEDKKPSVEDKKPSVEDKKQCLNTMYINDSCSIIIKLVREGRDVYIELTDEVQNETIEVANSRVVYSDYINNGINNKMLEKSLYRIVSIAKSKVKVDDIIKELIL